MLFNFNEYSGQGIESNLIKTFYLNMYKSTTNEQKGEMRTNVMNHLLILNTKNAGNVN